MAIQWWRIERGFTRSGRFYLYMVFTIAVVAYIVVPWMAQLFDAITGYNPLDYEPKDFARADRLERSQLENNFFAQFYPTWWQTALKLALLFLVGFLWLVAYSSSSVKGSRSRSTRR